MYVARGLCPLTKSVTDRPTDPPYKVAYSQQITWDKIVVATTSLTHPPPHQTKQKLLRRLSRDYLRGGHDGHLRGQNRRMQIVFGGNAFRRPRGVETDSAPRQQIRPTESHGRKRRHR